MVEKVIRGTTKQQEIKDDGLWVDTRSPLAKFFEWLKTPKNMAFFLTVHFGIAILFSPVADYMLLSSIIFTFFSLLKKEDCPLKMPIQSNFLDINEISPKTNGPSQAKGIFFVGNEKITGKEIWLTNDDCRTHFLILGTTGSGKTEALLGFASNAITWGSGFLFCDGKGDVALFAKVFALAKRFGREDDLLVLNFMTGNTDMGASNGFKRSNTLNPFSTGSSDSLTQMVVGLMDEVGGDGAMWKGRATAMFTGVMRALAWLRDQGKVDLNVGEIRDHLNIKKIIELSDTSKYPELPQSIRKSIRSYLTSLPGYVEEKKDKQGQTTLDQHGYLEMQFTKILGSLADVYGYIFKTPFGEVDMSDVVLNRRILVVMLPALEKSGDEIANLGKIIVATLKGMMGSTLGSKIEGSWSEIVSKRPTTSPSPFIIILDEVGYYTVDGMALMAAQARSLGFSLFFAAQDLPAMKRNNEKEANSIIANTNIKIGMKIEEMKETGSLFVDAGGKAHRTQMKGYQGNIGEISRTYMDTLDAGIETMDRINLLDLKSQTTSEMHITYGDKIIRGKSLYTDAENILNKKKLKLRTNHFITITKPDSDEIESQQKIPEILQKLLEPEFEIQMAQDAKAISINNNDEMGIITNIYEQMKNTKRRITSPIEMACISFYKLIEANKFLNNNLKKNSSDEDEDDILNSLTNSKNNSNNNFSLNDLLSDNEKFNGRFNDDDDEDDDSSNRYRDHEEKRRKSPFNIMNDDEDEEFKQPQKKQRIFTQPKVKKNIQHKININNSEMYDMVDKIYENDSVLSAMTALDVDPKTTTKEEVDDSIEEALAINAKKYIEEKSNIDEMEIASKTLSSSLDEDNDDSNNSNDDDDDVVSEFLSSLLSEDENNDEDK